MKRYMAYLGTALAVFLAVAPAWAYDVPPKNSTDGTPVPDVDKQGVPPAPMANDMGCWAATASNILGAAGWGVGATAQLKANSIYQDFITQFKVNAGDQYLTAAGDCAAAAKWWVHNVGLNAAKVGAGYDPNNQYVNFSLVERTLYEVDYNFLLNELVRCQYVGVKWQIPGADVGHGMTLVGGNYGPNGPVQPPTLPCESVWHNSDADAANPMPPPAWLDDEAYVNTWGGRTEWRLVVNPNPHDPVWDWWADGYFTACPGVPKPASAVGNFDVHHFIGIGALQPGGGAYDIQVTTLTTGAMYNTYVGQSGLYDPEWIGEGMLNVPNQVVEDLKKILYLSVDFREFENPDTTDVFQIQVVDEFGNAATLTDSQWASDNGQILLTYEFDNQPAWENIIFPIDAVTGTCLYQTLRGHVYEWNLATECVPEPVTLGLLGVGCLVALARRRRR